LSDRLLIEHALNGDENAITAFERFAHLLGTFLVPYIEKCRAHLIIIGSSIAQGWFLLENELNITLKKYPNVQVYFSLFDEKSICLGAVRQQLEILFKNEKNLVDKRIKMFYLLLKRSIRINMIYILVMKFH
jgi:predicted NBD/HSP70 family sugar kinase